RPRRRRRAHAPGDQGADPRRRNQKGRRTGRRPGGGHHGRQEDQRPHPHVPPAAAHRRGHRLFLGGFHPPNRGHGALHRRDRRGDGGTHRRVGGGAHRIRHVQGRPAGHGHHRHPPASQGGRQKRGLRCPGTGGT